jgi:hypothetical protein
MATKRAVAIATRVVSKDGGNDEDGKSDGNGDNHAIARKREMEREDDNKMTAR